MLRQLWYIYSDGFRHMPKWARILCVIVIAKVILLLLVFKLLLMPNYLNNRYTTETEKSNHVLNELTTNR